MSKMTFSKIKKLCSVALIPRILRDEFTLSPRKLGKRPLDGFWKMAKSTDSKDRDAECEKCKKLIEMVFGREKPDSVIKQVEANMEDIQIQKVIAPNVATINESNSPLAVESTKKKLKSVEKLPAEDSNVSIINNPIDQAALPLDNVLKSTTAKTTEEQLAQKLETIEEPGLVEAATPKIDGFNVPPKVLGEQENVLDSKNSLYTKIGTEEDALDEIAKKCLGTPPDKIDERILEEMKSCGMLGRGRKKPASNKSGYHHAMKRNENETLLETKSEQGALFYKNQQKNNSFLNNYSSMRYNNTNFAHNPQDIYPAYFKNVRLDLIGNGRSDKKKDKAKVTTLEHKEEKTAPEDITILQKKTSLPTSSDNSAIIDSEKRNPSIINQACNKIYLSKEESSGTIITEKPKDIIENEEVEVEEVRVTAAETSRLGIPGETEIDPDFDYKQTKPDMLPCNKVLQKVDNIEETLIEPNKHEHIVLINAKHPIDWHSASDFSDHQLVNPNTAISGTQPQNTPMPQEQNQEAEGPKYDTSISSNQNPAEYFDLSHCNIGQVNVDFPTTLSEIRPLAAFHQYTIITGADETEHSDDVLFSKFHSPEISLYHSSELKYNPEIEKQDLPKTIHNDFSATMGPLPQLKDLEEELSLSELLRRVRERNRLQYCRDAIKAVEAEPVESAKCPPPLEKPGKTLGPGPCKPKPKPACPPPPPTCPPPSPSPCKPKDPCAKFTKTSIIGNKIQEAFMLVLQVAFKPAYTSPSFFYSSKTNAIQTLRPDINDENRIEKLGSFILSKYAGNKKKRIENEDIILAKDYEPWSPIPSWPIPKKEKKERFVCPKEGCKIIPPPRLNSPCKENPCKNLPKRTLSIIDVDYEPLYLYNDEF